MRRVRVLLVTLAAGCGPTGSPDGADAIVSPGEPPEDVKADDAAGGRAEIKLTVATDAIDDVRDRLGLEIDRAEERDVWFYDDRDLVLFEGGAILRARKIVDHDDDSTVKMRPMGAEDVDPAWFELEGFKCELDWTPAKEVSSCSLTVRQDTGEIDDVADGERDIDKLFSGEQTDFFTAYAPAATWDAIEPLGPIDARVWTIESSYLPEKLVAELWRVGGEEFLELSMKVEVDEIADAHADLADWLDDRDVPLTDGDSKTRTALEILTAP